MHHHWSSDKWGEMDFFAYSWSFCLVELVFLQFIEVPLRGSFPQSKKAPTVSKKAPAVSKQVPSVSQKDPKHNCK